MNSTIESSVFPAVPEALARLPSRGGCRVSRRKDAVVLANDYVAVAISTRTGTIQTVTNRLLRAPYALRDDRFGFTAVTAGDRAINWVAQGGKARRFSVRLRKHGDSAEAVLRTRHEGVSISVTYSLHRSQFWAERRMTVEPGARGMRLDRLVYGKLDVLPAGKARMAVRILDLGLFDRPRLISVGEGGGVFGGPGWWFYSVDENGIYQNTNMDFPLQGRFDVAPWYVGVFRDEAGEAYPGWLWYKLFLQARKIAYDKQPAWSYWNAGWGQWGIDVDEPTAPAYLELCRRLGIRQVAFGGGFCGKGNAEYIRLARENATARKNIRTLKHLGIGFGYIEPGRLNDGWNDPAVVDAKIRDLQALARGSTSACHFDFFYPRDTFVSHWNAARYMRAARSLFDYTECHLGMAKYGPQFQREAMVNHPDDIGGFDISNFSADWVSFRAFRHSRRQWQQKLDYLVPEYGLYYFLTHYANPHPCMKLDPEPHEFLCSYGWLGTNFHDRVGYREVLMAAAAFTPFYIFGHLDLDMPADDVRFTRRVMDWVAANSELLREARVCFEDENACVVSKIRGTRGAIFLVNYDVGERIFRLTLDLAGPSRLQPVYPARGPARRVAPGRRVEYKVRGGSVLVLNVNSGLRTLPPENPRRLPVAIAGWAPAAGRRLAARIEIPNVAASLKSGREASLPRQLLSIDQFHEDPNWAVSIPKALGVSRESLPVDIEWLHPSPYADGKGLSKAFVQALGMKDGVNVATWKVAPWAYAKRLWLVWKPVAPLLLSSRQPTVEVNGRSVELIPRVDYRRKAPKLWDCPLFFADITQAARPGKSNTVQVAGLPSSQLGLWYITGPA